MPELFNVVFAGEIAGKTDPAVVRANVGKLFNASEAILDKLFSGQPVAIKKMVDRDTAMQLRAKMKLAGANTRLIPVDEQGRPLPEGGAVAPAPAPAPAVPAQPMVVRVNQLAEEHARAEAAKPKKDGPPDPADINLTSTWALFPVGWILGIPEPARLAPPLPNMGRLVLAPVGAELLSSQERTVVTPVQVDVSGISIAATGTDLLAAKERTVVAPVQVDVSGISIAAVGADVLRAEEKRQVTPVQVDVSGISVAAVGSDLEQIKDVKKAVAPDISHLSIQKG